MAPRRPRQSQAEEEIETLEAAVDLVQRDEDRDAGLVPPDVRRALFSHEVSAHVNFAALDDDVLRRAATLAGVLGDVRTRLLEVLARDLAGVTPFGGTAVARRVLDVEQLGPNALAGGVELVEVAVARARVELEEALRAGAARLRAEAVAQGLVTTPGLPAVPADVAGTVELAARRAVLATVADTMRALRDVAVQTAPGAEGVDVATRVLGAGRDLAPSVLDQHARQAVAGADGLGRQLGSVGLPEPAAVYASELLDRNTCGPCSLVDGRKYPNLAAARADYPGGIYRLCEGGLRCRGTLVFVWAEESPATVG